ncbi:MAG: ribonuclease H-like domain-containing protein [Bacteroidales bacterium]|jgi:DNA polymerase elongation subunit (family B)|nr:ribonuclease H-like domain-containing protein [Bacteroidales bacterium]NLM92329.1 3'-5' exonuclease [Bacteroidales bacterium]
MLANINLFRILFLDVETVPMARDFDSLPEVFQGLWEKKAANLKNVEELSPAQLFERAGIYAEFGKIVCVSAGFFHKEEDQLSFRVKSFYGDDEKLLLMDFAELLNEHFNSAAHYLCAHNGKEFDFPYLSRRMLINGLDLPYLLDNFAKKPWETTLLDTMELWKFGDYKSYTSLELLSAVFNIPTPKDDISGKDVARVYWVDNDLERIATYCAKDVVTIARLYLKYRMAGELHDEQVFYLS